MANDYARLMAFQKTGPAVEAFEKAMKYIPIIKALYVPFLRTPLNLVRAGMVDRNPALAWLTKENQAAFRTYFAALDGQEKALSRGGAEADIVMARMVSGMALMGTAAMLFANGDLVGKRTPAEEQDGIKSYSVRLGGRWYQYSTLSPLAEMIGITADLYQTMRDRDLTDDQATAMAGGVAGAIMNNIVNKAALQGVRDFFDLLDPSFSNTESSRGTAVTKAAFKKLGDSLVPAIVRNTAQAQDPVMREASEFLEGSPYNDEHVVWLDLEGDPACLIHAPSFQAFTAPFDARDAKGKGLVGNAVLQSRSASSPGLVGWSTGSASLV